MGPVKPRKESVNLLRKDHHIPIVGWSDEGDSFHLTEVLRSGESDPHAISRVRAIGDHVLTFQSRCAWILDAELLVGSERAVARGR